MDVSKINDDDNIEEDISDTSRLEKLCDYVTCISLFLTMKHSTGLNISKNFVFLIKGMFLQNKFQFRLIVGYKN